MVKNFINKREMINIEKDFCNLCYRRKYIFFNLKRKRNNSKMEKRVKM